MLLKHSKIFLSKFLLGDEQIDILIEPLTILTTEPGSTINILVIIGVPLACPFLLPLVTEIKGKHLLVVLIARNLAIHNGLIVGDLFLVDHFVVLDYEQEVCS